VSDLLINAKNRTATLDGVCVPCRIGRAGYTHDAQGREGDAKTPLGEYIRLPYAASHERLWREDGAYDIVLVISHNDSPPVPGLGSAVFLHIAQPDDRLTLGCIAFTPEAMVRLLPELRSGMAVRIHA